MTPNAIANWPGKSSPEGSGLPEHPAVYHMLDVAAVAERLIDPFRYDKPLRDAMILLIALHDLGKISDNFRNAVRYGMSQENFGHWKLTEVLLFESDPVLECHLGSNQWVRRDLYAAVSGHHGRPSDLRIGPLECRGRRPLDYRNSLRRIGQDASKDAGDVVIAFCELWPEAALGDISEKRSAALSWWLPGLCTAADWVGSNTRWFKPKKAGVGLSDYLKDAREISVCAVSEAGLAGSEPANTRLFDFDLRPMQKACANIDMVEGPMLAIIEDETGAGKTEAALFLAQRMLLAGKGRGIFFALPTMATADAMFRRASKVVGKMFGNGITLTLAHGRAGLSVDFKDIINADVREDDEVTCSEFLSQSRRRALLADVGVGTIDQALMSVLPVKHQSLRHFGLSSKILIVDEVHELGEPYISSELEALLRMHRTSGGSAILLTATLPMVQRERLLNVYEGTSNHSAYPALTVAKGVSVIDLPQTIGPKGSVKVERLSHADEAVRLLAENAGQGAACVWVRNAVDDAISAVASLRSKGVRARLLHARFVLGDRKRIESEVMDHAGKVGKDRNGFVLVGTQVLESSLDLDFDAMVSDLAPVAALIQRAGRLWRHMDIRPVASRPVDGPTLHVLSPDPDKVENDRWLHDVLDSGAYVYPVTDQWRTAQVLFREGKIDAPPSLRSLIEPVHGADAIPVPDVLQNSENAVEGQGLSARCLAAHNIVNLGEGYRSGGRAHDDTEYPTRLGSEQKTLVLAVEENGKLRPWAGHGEDSWPLSEVSASRERLDRLPLPDQSMHEIHEVIEGFPKWKRKVCERGGYHICPVGPDGSICDGLTYDADVGLSFGDQE